MLKFFVFAFRGIFSVLKKERNFKIHLIAASTVVLLGLIVNLNKLEWGLLIVIIAVILSAEIFNSAIEEICNLLKEKLDLRYKETTFIRNAAAGAVLLLAIASVILAWVIFWPHLFK